jgi:uncharacterized protein (TIGR03437 family)
MGHFRSGLLIFLLLQAVTFSQPPGVNIPTGGTVGVPYTLDFGQVFGLQNIPPTAGVSFTYSFTLAGGTLPPGISLSASGLLSGTPTTAGQYSFTINLNLDISVPGAPAFNYSFPFPFTINVQGATGPQISVQPGLLSFPFTLGAAASSQSISVINKGAQAAAYSASASTKTGGSWLSVSGAGSAPPFGQGSIQVTANPAGLDAGTYTGYVTCTAGASQFNISVVMTVTGSQQIISLSQSGLTFRAVSGGGAPPPQSFGVLNGGEGNLNWTASGSMLSGSSWLSFTPPNGSSSAAAALPVSVRVNPAGLAPGDYYGKVQVSADGVANSPQAVSVVLTVLPATGNLNPSVLPTGLIFVGTAGAADPARQSLQITNLSSKPLTYTTNIFLDQTGTKWLAPPSGGTVTPAQPVNVSVQPTIAGLVPGVYTGDLTIFFVEINTTQHIPILLVVIPHPTSSPKPDSPRDAGGCNPTKLLPIFTQLGQSFIATAAWPAALEVTVIDDCGNPMTSGSVVTTFSNGDPSLSLTNLRDGRWSGTWQPRNALSAPVTITAGAQITAPPLKGTASVGGNLQPNVTTPLIKSGGVVSAASLAPQAPLAPGSYVSIQGSNFAPGLMMAGSLPLPTTLNGMQVLLAGRQLALRSTSDGQINAIIPYDVPPNATHQMIVQRGTAASVPEPVTIAAAQPAIFTQDGSGMGPGMVVDMQPDGTQFLVTAGNPASAGDTVVIYCSGLGPVDPPVAAGDVIAPDSPGSQTTNPVTVTIGGVPATVQFAGMAPFSFVGPDSLDFAGLYQVSVTLPDGVTPAPDTPLIVTVAGQDSPPVTIATQ